MEKDKFSAGSQEIGFEGSLPEVFTAHAGVSLLLEAARQGGEIAMAGRVLPKKQNLKGLTQGRMVEALVVLSALGGECVEDLERLRKDQGLLAILGYPLPAPSTARTWLEQFHDAEAVAERPLWVSSKLFVRENWPLSLQSKSCICSRLLQQHRIAGSALDCPELPPWHVPAWRSRTGPGAVAAALQTAA